MPKKQYAECGSIYVAPDRPDYRHLCTQKPGHAGKHKCWNPWDGTLWTDEEEQK